jgi:phage tail-like protein
MPPVDPYRNFNFVVEIGGVSQAGFSDCSGFGASTDAIEYREGGENTYSRKLPGQTKYPNIVLKWGLTDSRDLWDWYQDVVQGRIRRLDGRIVVRDIDAITEKVSWNFFSAWPTKWDGPDFSAKGNDVAIETLEIAVERLERG